MNTIKFDRKNVKVIAHRGLSGLETENTNSAFVAAGNRSYFGIETDIHVTPDDKFVVIHDNLTVRVSNEVINVEETPYTKVRSVKLNNICRYDKDGICKNDERGDLIIPSLAEYVGICRKYEKECVLELKNAFQPKHIKLLAEELKALDYIENIVFISFDFDNLVMLRKILPTAKIQYLVSEYSSNVLEKLNRYNMDLDINYKNLTEKAVKEVRENGHEVNCWTCDSKEDAEKLVSWGVDYITTNILE